MKIITVLAFVVSSFSAAQVSFASDSAWMEVETLFFSQAEQPVQLEVKYFAHNNPNIQEFITGKSRISALLARVTTYGFLPRVKTLGIGIAPGKMSGGSVVETDEKLYVSITATDDEIERGLLRFFEVIARYGDISYFMHNFPSLDEFHAGRIKVEAVLQRFGQAGLKLDLPSALEIGIAPRTMVGGNVIEKDGKIFVSVTATDDEIERHFMKFVSP